MGEEPREIGRVRTLADGTFLFRKNKTTPTYHLTAEQYGEIKSLQTKEYVATYLPAPIFMAYGPMTFFGSHGLLWKITTGFILFYCVFNFFFSRQTWRKIDRICEAAVLASPENTIVFSSPANGLRKILSMTSDRNMRGTALLFSAYAIAGVLILASLFIGTPFAPHVPLHWGLKLFIGLGGIFFFGGYAYFAIEEIRRRRDAKLQNPEGDKT